MNRPPAFHSLIAVAVVLTGMSAVAADLQVKDAAVLKKVEREIIVRDLIDRAEKLDLDAFEKPDKDLNALTTEKLLELLRSNETDQVYEPDTRRPVPRSLLGRIAPCPQPPCGPVLPADLAGVPLSDELRHNLRGVAAVFMDDQLAQDGADLVLKDPQTYAAREKLCPDTLFENDIAAAICTAFLYTDDIMATAGHCVSESTVTETRFIFGFDDDGRNKRFPAADVYTGMEVVERSTGTLDYALVRLDRAVTGREALKINFDHDVRVADSVYVIGHPAGLPLKFAPEGSIVETNLIETFVAKVDILGGSSGSPVILQSSHEVIGILAHGQDGYLRIGTCRFLRQCPVGPFAGCDGEGCTRVTQLQLRPKAPAPVVAWFDEPTETVAAAASTPR